MSDRLEKFRNGNQLPRISTRYLANIGYQKRTLCACAPSCPKWNANKIIQIHDVKLHKTTYMIYMHRIYLSWWLALSLWTHNLLGIGSSLWCAIEEREKITTSFQVQWLHRWGKRRCLFVSYEPEGDKRAAYLRAKEREEIERKRCCATMGDAKD